MNSIYLVINTAQNNLKAFIDILSGLLAPLVAAATVYIAYQQWQTNERKRKQDLFNIRYNNLFKPILENADNYDYYKNNCPTTIDKTKIELSNNKLKQQLHKYKFLMKKQDFYALMNLHKKLCDTLINEMQYLSGDSQNNKIEVKTLYEKLKSIYEQIEDILSKYLYIEETFFEKMQSKFLKGNTKMTPIEIIKGKLKNFFAAKTNFFNKEEEIENNNSKIEQITTINLYPIIENFGKFIPIALILFVLFNFLYNFFYFLNYDLSLTHLLKLSDYYEGGAVCFSIFCVLISFVYLCKNKFIKPLKIFIDIFIFSIAILFLITNFINLENVNIIPIFVLIFLIGSLFLKFENHIILANLMNVIIVIILFASFNFLMEYNSYTKLVQTKQNEEYYLMRQISDGVLVRNKDGSILFYRWENVKNIKYSILTSANFIFKFWEKDFKLKLINKAPKYIIIKGRNQQEGRDDLWKRD